MSLMSFSDRAALLYLILLGLARLCKVGFLTEPQKEGERWGRVEWGGGGGYVEEKELCVFGRGGW